MLREHNERLPECLDKARHMTRVAMRKVAALTEDVRAKSQQVSAALQARDRWREQVEAVTQMHRRMAGGHGCTCGSKGCDVPEIIQEVQERQREQRHFL